MEPSIRGKAKPSSRGISSKPRRKNNVYVTAFGLTIFVFSTLTFYFQHTHLKSTSTNINDVVASSKNAFLRNQENEAIKQRLIEDAKIEQIVVNELEKEKRELDNQLKDVEKAHDDAASGKQSTTLEKRSEDKSLSVQSASTEERKGDKLLKVESSSLGENKGSIIPIDLTVNYLHLIQKAPGAPPEPIMASSASSARSNEDFLPIVTPKSIQFRWRHEARTGAKPADLRVTGYRVIVKGFGGGTVLWDSGKVDVNEENGTRIKDVKFKGSNLAIGQILQWSVTLWDGQHVESTSSWTKFAVGPDHNDWKGKWMAHPSDMDAFDRNTERGKKNKPIETHANSCTGWKLRRPLPLFRTKLSIRNKEDVVSALLVVSGLGSFRASVNGVPLSTSGPIDPPFTDYSKRVMYRGFDITPFAKDPEMVIGMTMGSGWWDHRPLTGMAKPVLLPNGPVTAVAQVVVTYKSGESVVVGETGEGKGWQVSRGHIRESDLFTGETVDLDVLETMEGWDTSIGWKEAFAVDSANMDPYSEINKWVGAVAYRTDVILEVRVQRMSIMAKAMKQEDAKSYPGGNNFADPIGKLVPHEIPPVMSMERLAPDEMHDLGSGRWLLDFGKAFSGMLHFDEGIPEPIIPESYPRAHGFKAASANGDGFITVVYGESLEMTTGDINRLLVAGLGLHDGGPTHRSKPAGTSRRTPCFPDDHEEVLTQRDVYVIPKDSSDKKSLYAKARQSHFTTHAFRFAEICCTKEPPKGVHALLYRTAVPEWGNFDSSNVNINGGYELVKNSMVSNMLSVQSDCPHREKLPYGGDLVANSPAALAFFDMSSFYKKTIYDWLDAQWANGAYTETSIWQNLNDYAGIGQGAGETVWASLPAVLTVRHYQNYGDEELLRSSLPSHVKWLEFLDKYFDAAMEEKGYDKELDEYKSPPKSGLGDWLSVRTRDTFLTHTGFYMASGRCVAYVAHMLDKKEEETKGMSIAKKIRDRISYLYLKNGKDNFDFPHGSTSHTPGPEMSLFSRIVPGEKRCIVLKNWFKRAGHTWPGDEEMAFINAMSDEDKNAWIESKELTKRGDRWAMGWSQWQGFNEGIFAIRYSMKTLSEMGFHNIALRKATGHGFATFEYMMSHNSTTMWESFWRSEDLYSRNHPMLGAVAEWMSSSAAGVSLHPTTTGGRRMLFWPQMPKSASTLEFASAEQGSIRGDYAIAWRFEGLPKDESQYDSGVVGVRIRLLVPPSGEADLQLPLAPYANTKATLRHARTIPDLSYAKSEARKECDERRRKRLGFSYNWDYNNSTQKWFKRLNRKAIGTPCYSFLFHPSLDKMEWSEETDVTRHMAYKHLKYLPPGFHEVIITNWQLEKEVEGKGRIGNIPEYFQSEGDLGHCKEDSDFDWNIADATHII